MIVKFFENFKERLENTDPIFVCAAIFCPSFLFCFRMYLWYNDFYILFDPVYKYNRILEPFIFCYLPSVLIFYFISKKSKKSKNSEKISLFYSNRTFGDFYKKISYVFDYFNLLGKVELFICRSLITGFIVIPCVLLLYLFLLRNDSPFIHLRILLLSPYLSFTAYLRQDLLKKHKESLPKTLLELRHQLENAKVKALGSIFSVYYTLLFSLLFGLDCYMGNVIQSTEGLCDRDLQEIEERLSGSGNQNDIKRYQELSNKKVEVFGSIGKKFLFFRASLFVFDFIQRPDFVEVWSQIHLLHDKIC